MKKSYLYFVVPLVLTAIFGVFYAKYASVYEEREARMEAQKKLARQQKLEEDAKMREKAIADAQVQSEKRKKEKEEKETRLLAERDAREKAAAERDKAGQERVRFAEAARRLEKEIEEAKEGLTKLERSHKELREEEAFLREYVKQAEANTQHLTGVLEKIEAAEKARAAAAAAAKKSS